MLSLHPHQQIEETGGAEVVVLDFRRHRLKEHRASSPAVRVVIADVQTLVREGIRVLLEAVPPPRPPEIALAS